jgi:hypothetical protein
MKITARECRYQWNGHNQCNGEIVNLFLREKKREEKRKRREGERE